VKFLELARKLSFESTAKQQKMAAVIVRGGAVLSVGINHKWNHAETRAIRPHRYFGGSTIYVMRSNGRCSRPCLDCQRKIIQAGIDRAVYIALDGTVVTERYATG
jgi:deoxycytidylate deaminase